MWDLKPQSPSDPCGRQAGKRGARCLCLQWGGNASEETGDAEVGLRPEGPLQLASRGLTGVRVAPGDAPRA